MKVFISHQKKDREQAKLIAAYLEKAGISVYFDEYDRALQSAVEKNDSKAIVNAIKKGVHTSTHMLAIVSKNTLSSEWVPFEVGYGYDKVDLAILTLKNITNEELPEYAKVVTIIRDIYDINKFVEKHALSYSIEALNESRNFSKNTTSDHPLSSIMDDMITG